MMHELGMCGRHTDVGRFQSVTGRCRQTKGRLRGETPGAAAGVIATLSLLPPNVVDCTTLVSQITLGRCRFTLLQLRNNKSCHAAASLRLPHQGVHLTFIGLKRSFDTRAPLSSSCLSATQARLLTYCLP
jgi:hypothetical protein